MSEKPLWLLWALSAVAVDLKVVHIPHNLPTPELQNQVLHFRFASPKITC